MGEEEERGGKRDGGKLKKGGEVGRKRDGGRIEEGTGGLGEERRRSQRGGQVCFLSHMQGCASLCHIHGLRPCMRG